jgi:hypothetical protein
MIRVVQFDFEATRTAKAESQISPNIAAPGSRRHIPVIADRLLAIVSTPSGFPISAVE